MAIFLGYPNPKHSQTTQGINPIAKSLHLEGSEIARPSDVEDVAGIHQRFSSGLSHRNLVAEFTSKKTGPRSGILAMVELC